MPEVPKNLEAEKQELNWLLGSGVLGRSSNLTKMLTYICEKHFLGRDDEIREHLIAVEALGRRDDFDPQSDTIVRVVAHSLRKRLQEIYQTIGADRPVQILIPTGHYTPSFIDRDKDAVRQESGLLTPDFSQPDEKSASSRFSSFKAWVSPRIAWLVPAALLGSLSAAGILVHLAHNPPAKPLSAASVESLPTPILPKDTIHALMGAGRQAYVDHSGISWAPGNYCSGGDSVALPLQKVAGTEDPYLYLSGIRGIAHCKFPLKQGDYEVHFHFAEMTDLPTATRPAILSINAGADINFDVVDQAGGDGIATSMVLTGVRPEPDGAIHLDYTSEVSLLNAVEILPADSAAQLPVRITASPASIADSSRKVWLSDRYFTGGRRGQYPDSGNTEKKGVFSYNRIGRFRYDIPATPKGKYRITLYFLEPWFGRQNSGTGGPGSRVFDVSCNGNILLKNFDIMAEGGENPVVKTFDDIEATAKGKIELSFIPEVNYPLVNAIEVVAEPAH